MCLTFKKINTKKATIVMKKSVSSPSDTAKAITPIDTRDSILENAKQLFAVQGYEGLSMRDLARALNMSASVIYHYFPDKEALYVATIEYAYSKNGALFNAPLVTNQPATERLRLFVLNFCRFLAADPDFVRLIKREQLGGNEIRLRYLAEHLLAKQFKAMRALFTELAPDLDTHIVSMSLLGAILHLFETQHMRHFLPGHRKDHDNAEFIAETIYVIFSNIGKQKTK